MTSKRPRVGVVIGSGGIKAFSAIPLLELLAGEGIEVDLLVGCSGGSLVAAGWAAGYSPEEMRRILGEESKNGYTSQVDYASILGLASGRRARAGRAPGLLKVQALQRLLHRLFEGKRLEDLRPRLRIQATDLDSGNPVVLGSGPVADAVYASCACFPLLPPLKVNGRWLVDGAFSAPLPVMEAVKRGMDLVIAVDFAGGVRGEPRTFLDFFQRSIHATTRALTASQMALAIGMHHHQIVSVHVGFERDVQVWDMDQVPAILETGRRAVSERRAEILEAFEGARSARAA